MRSGFYQTCRPHIIKCLLHKQTESKAWANLANKHRMKRTLNFLSLLTSESSSTSQTKNHMEFQKQNKSWSLLTKTIWMFPKIGVGFLQTLQIIHLFIGFGTIIFTIHFGGFTPIFGFFHPFRVWSKHLIFRFAAVPFSSKLC